ncbi:MAG: EscU/YscU/HrcU family type III secretion system export apparatus switch protein [Phenylobacterium sp.]|uniref:EscU/YscU/HrcU family type III secretion system export apparatus switch protein n=1 Tax=Phenylobacterium sp. TaxID=1871053 RepID=UPI003BB4A738
MSNDRRLAVALQYDAPGAPRVVAAGRGLVGERIIATAQAHGVPLEHNPLLAEALSKVELDAEIPERLFVAVAEILAFLMREGVEPQTGA